MESKILYIASAKQNQRITYADSPRVNTERASSRSHSEKRPTWLQKRPCLLRLCSVLSKLLHRQAVSPGNDLTIQRRMAGKAQRRGAEVRLLPNPVGGQQEKGHGGREGRLLT